MTAIARESGGVRGGPAMKARRFVGCVVFLVLTGMGRPPIWGQDAVRELEKRLETPPGVQRAEGAQAEPVAELPEPARAPAPPEDPAVPRSARPSLGISVDDVKELTRRRFSVTVNAGAVITQIRPGTPAARAGLPLGGVIVSVNGKRIGSADELVEFIQAFRPGDSVEITYFEGDRIGRKKLSLAPAPPVIAPKPSTAKPLTTDASDPPLRLGRGRVGKRPLLDALERALDGAAPAGDAAADAAAAANASQTPPAPPAPGMAADAPEPDDALPAIEPPPPPAPDGADPAAGRPPAAGHAELPPPPADGTSKSVVKPGAHGPADDAAQELAELRRQRDVLQKQLEEVQRRIEALEGKE